MRKVLFITILTLYSIIGVQAQTNYVSGGESQTAITTQSSGSVSKPRKPKTDANIAGHVVNKSTGEHIPYVLISIKGTQISVSTDATGHFYLKNLPTGKFTIEARLAGYKSQEIEINTESNKLIEINFELEEDAIMLESLVVSSNKNEVRRQDAATIVGVLTPSLMEHVNANNLSQGLNYQPGLRVEDNCQNCGAMQLRINGLDGAYSQILIDSRPIYGTLTGVYGLEQIPANMIERVEVIRGGGSALFGASAIGGVVNIITKEPTRSSGSLTHTLGSIGGKAWDNNTSFNASMLSDNGKAGIMLYGQHRVRGAYDHDGDGFSELPVLKNRSFGFRSFMKTGLYSKLSLEYHNMHEFRRGGDNLELQPFEAEVTEQQEHFINGGGLTYSISTPNLKNNFKIYTSAQHTLRKSYYGGGEPLGTLDLIDTTKTSVGEAIEQANEQLDLVNQRLNSFGRSTELIYQAGGQYTRYFDRLLFMPAELTTGVEYLYNALNDKSGYRKDDITQKSNTYSLFLQNEWKNKNWGILLGARLDKHTLVKNPIFSPRVNLRYSPIKTLGFRLSYSEGFRAPQFFDEDLHVDIAGGEQIVRILSPDLREERSRSLSGSADYYFNISSVQVNLLAEGFFTHLLNAFDTREGEVVDGILQKIVYNSSGAKVYGGNFEARMAYRRLFDLQMGFTLQQALFDEAREPLDGVEATREFMRSPKAYGYFVAAVRPVTDFSIALSGNYTGRMYVPHEEGSGVIGVDRFATENRIERSPRFFELGAKLAYDFSVFKYSTLQVNAGVQNIFNSYQKDFDTGAGRASSYIYGPSAPRSYFLGVKLTI